MYITKTNMHLCNPTYPTYLRATANRRRQIFCRAVFNLCYRRETAFYAQNQR